MRHGHTAFNSLFNYSSTGINNEDMFKCVRDGNIIYIIIIWLTLDKIIKFPNSKMFKRDLEFFFLYPRKKSKKGESLKTSSKFVKIKWSNSSDIKLLNSF